MKAYRKIYDKAITLFWLAIFTSHFPNTPKGIPFSVNTGNMGILGLNADEVAMQLKMIRNLILLLCFFSFT
jgi:hypothetical protein